MGDENGPGGKLTRRDFLGRFIRTGLTAAAACAAGYLGYDPTGPVPASEPAREVVLPDFSIAGGRPRMAVARGGNRRKTLGAAFEALGGLGAFIKQGDRVLIKVNAAFATPPLLCATTHPDIVAELSRRCLAAGAAAVTVTDNPINDPASCFRLTGIEKAAREAGAGVMLPADRYFRPLTVAGGKLIRRWPVLYRPLEKIDKLIGVAPVKDHHRSGASMTMKNWYGLLGGRRNLFHQDIHNTIKELAMMVRPTLVVLDGTASMMKNGPTGGSVSDLKQTDTLIVSTDQVAADAFGATLLEKSPEDLPYIAKAEAAGVGRSDYTALNPILVSAD